MKREVQIILKSRHDRAGEAPEISEITARGFYEITADGIHRIIYDESQQVQDEKGNIVTVNAQNTVQIFEQKVEITRSGDATSHMIFSQGNTHPLKYNTPYGIIEMEITTNNLDKSIGEKVIRLKVDYDLNMENQTLSRSSIEYNIDIL